MLPVERRQNLFQIFDLEATFDIDLAELETRYKRMQMKFHPDRFAAKEQLVWLIHEQLTRVKLARILLGARFRNGPGNSDQQSLL